MLLLRATDGVRTRDPDLGKVVLYQLSHCRIFAVPLTGTIDTILHCQNNVNTFFAFFLKKSSVLFQRQVFPCLLPGAV